MLTIPIPPNFNRKRNQTADSSKAPKPKTKKKTCYLNSQLKHLPHTLNLSIQNLKVTISTVIKLHINGAHYLPVILGERM
jgi:hypothetical protein